MITGVDGFIGANLAKKLLSMGSDVAGLRYLSRGNGVSSLDLLGCADGIRSVWGDVLNLKDLKSSVKIVKPKIIFHLAAQAIVREAESSPYSCFQTNIMGTINVLEAARQVDTSVIVASSDKAYGESPPPYREETELKPERSGPYSVSKACADMIARSYTHTYGLPVAVTRCSNTYGSADLNFSRLIPYVIKCLIKGETPKLHAGVEEVYREYTYIDDVVDAYILLAERIDDAKGDAYNVGSGFIATRDQLVNKIFQLMGVEISPEFAPSGFKEIKSQYLSSEKIRSLGWQPKINFDEGLRRTIDWYRRFLS